MILVMKYGQKDSIWEQDYFTHRQSKSYGQTLSPFISLNFTLHLTQTSNHVMGTRTVLSGSSRELLKVTEGD
jgi:hypothetical protein